MTDDQFKTLCKKIDNIANVIVIEGYVAIIMFCTWVFIHNR